MPTAQNEPAKNSILLIYSLLQQVVIWSVVTWSAYAIWFNEQLTHSATCCTCIVMAIHARPAGYKSQAEQFLHSKPYEHFYAEKKSRFPAGNFDKNMGKL